MHVHIRCIKRRSVHAHVPSISLPDCYLSTPRMVMSVIIMQCVARTQIGSTFSRPFIRSMSSSLGHARSIWRRRRRGQQLNNVHNTYKIPKWRAWWFPSEMTHLFCCVCAVVHFFLETGCGPSMWIGAHMMKSIVFFCVGHTRGNQSMRWSILWEMQKMCVICGEMCVHANACVPLHVFEHIAFANGELK